MAKTPGFAQLVSLACHDLRTPLATVAGFASTLARDEQLGEPTTRYVGMIEAAASQLADLVDQLALVARIEAGRYDPTFEEKDTLELVRTAAEQVGSERAEARGTGGSVRVEADTTERALAALALAAFRHGALDRVELEAAGIDVNIAPVRPEAAAVVLGQNLRDLGAAAAVTLVDALGGSVTVEGETLRVRLPPA